MTSPLHADKTEIADLPPTNMLAVYEQLSKGGQWLASARSWMQSNVRNGDQLTWGSGEVVTLPFYKLEELALRVAVAAVSEDRPEYARQAIKDWIARQEVVAHMWQHDETGRVGFVDAGQDLDHWAKHNPRLQVVRSLIVKDAA